MLRLMTGMHACFGTYNSLAYVYLKITDLVTHSVVDDIALYFTVDYPHQLRKTQFLRKFYDIYGGRLNRLSQYYMYQFRATKAVSLFRSKFYYVYTKITINCGTNQK